MGVIKVSVVMAVYNAMPYLRQALDSVVGQTLKDIEIICVDDRSTDGSHEVLQEYAARDPRMTILQHTEETEGAAAARNMGLDVAKGEYLSILDADDFFELDMLEKAYDKAHAEKADVLVFDGWHYDNSFEVDYVGGQFMEYRLLDDAFMSGPQPPDYFLATAGMAWNKLFLRRFVEREGLRFLDCRHTDDMAFVYVALYAARHCTVLNERLVHYRRFNEGQSAASVSWPETGYKGPYQVKCQLVERGIYPPCRVAFVNFAVSFAVNKLLVMDDLSSFKSLFYELQEGYLEKLDAFAIADEEFQNREIVEYRDDIMSCTHDEFLFRHQASRKHGTDKKKEQGFLLDLLRRCGKDRSRVAIYGAGQQGKRVFDIFRKYPMAGFHICAWADRNYGKIGFPVETPDAIRAVDPDCLIIAIKNKAACQEARDELLGMGIDEEKLYFPFLEGSVL